SAPAIDAARSHFALNGLDAQRHEFLVADVFDYLEEAQKQDEQFDVVVLDPPAFAKSQNARSQALKAYRRLNTLGMQVLRPGGILLTCSCSGVIGMDDLLGAFFLSVQRLIRSVLVFESYLISDVLPIYMTLLYSCYWKGMCC